MTKAVLFAVTLFAYCQVVFSENSICDICECFGDNPNVTVKLDCSNCKLKNLPAPESTLLTLTNLDLRKNYITKLDDLEYGFLEVLDLSFNEIDFIKPGVFKTVRDLKNLDMTFNNLDKTLDQATFHGLENLLTLNISHNRMSELEVNMFSVFVELQELVLDNNPISDLHFLKNLRNLKRLHLREMDLRYLSEKLVFEKLDKLEFLDLSGNRFHRVPTEGISGLTSLKHLILNTNDIQILNADSFPNLTALEVLEINDMRKLSSVGQFSFSRLRRLKVLVMEYNSDLVSFHQNAFGMKTPDNLKEVLLRYNKISRLQGERLCDTDLLDLQGNPWRCDCELRWILNCSAVATHVSEELKCSSPRKLLSQNILVLEEDDLQCTEEDEERERHLSRIYRTVALGVAIISFVLIAALIIFFLKGKCMDRWSAMRKQGDGSVYYVKVHSKRYSVN